MEPTPEDIRIAKQQALQVQQKHDAKNARRRARRQAAKGHVTDFESDEDDEEEEQSTPPISTHAGQAEKPTAGPSSGQRSLGPEETGARPKERRPTNPGNERADMVQELFGSVSDISSSNTGSDKTPTMAIMRTLEVRCFCMSHVEGSLFKSDHAFRMVQFNLSREALLALGPKMFR